MTLKTHISLANYTTWRVGGPADIFIQPDSINALCDYLKAIPAKTPITWLGLGSNTLIRDGGIEGAVIHLQKYCNQISTIDTYQVRAEAGASCATLARYCARASLSGAAFWAGIPGTIGGALAMNAGCHDGTTWEYVHSVETLDRQGNCHLRFPSDFTVGYRSVTPHHAEEWFVAATFALSHGDKQQELEEIRTLLAHRAATQPAGEPSGGSTFRNPASGYAGQLIEACGLKGYSLGGARVSLKHANFLVNTGKACAEDIESLIAYVQQQVAGKFGVYLMPEVQIMGRY